METEGLREVQRRMWEMADELAALRERDTDEAELSKVRAEAELAEVRAQAGQLRGALINAHDQLLRRDGEILRLQSEIDRLQPALKAREDELEFVRQEGLRARIRLERILSSPPARAYSALGSMPGLRGLKNARTTGYQAAVKSAQTDAAIDG